MLVFGPHLTINSISDVISSSYEDYLAEKKDPIFDFLPTFEIKNKSILQITIAHEIYNHIKTHLQTLDKSKGKIAVLGGITLKIENSPDFFLPLMFEVCKENRYEVFGNLSLEPEGCVNYIYLKDLFEKYTNWKSDDIAKNSRFEDEKLSDGALNALKKVNFKESDFLKINL